MGILLFDLADGQRVDRTGSSKPYLVRTWREQVLNVDDAGMTHYGYVLEGSVDVEDARGRFHVEAGMYFVLVGASRINPSGASPGMLLSRCSYHGLRMAGGPVESPGRLVYIDGCSDTVLIGPPRVGDPCLNYLHIPAGIRQKAHFHPSDRVGVIAAGRGRCLLPEEGREVLLKPGLGWLIEEGTFHCFYTDTNVSDEELDVIAWHPDSDTGPADGDHPMLNRTLVVGGRAVRGVRSGRTLSDEFDVDRKHLAQSRDE